MSVGAGLRPAPFLLPPLPTCHSERPFCFTGGGICSRPGRYYPSGFVTMSLMPDRSRARELAAESFATGDPLGWFENLYREAAAGLTTIPWDDRVPNSHLIDFWSLHGIPGSRRRALVVGCGLGQD